MEEKKNAKMTREELHEVNNYFKVSDNDKILPTENVDNIEKVRVYGVKTLQAYITEIEMLRKQDGAIVEEHYFKDGKEVNLQDLASGSGLTAMLALLSKEVKNVCITKTRDILTGGIIHRLNAVYMIDLF